MAYIERGAKVGRPVLCAQCDSPEASCNCEKYCCFCQAQFSIRLCVDGLYYCPDCREACEIRTADERPMRA